MVHDPEVGSIMGYDRGILATTEQYAAFTPTDPTAKGVAAYEEEVATAGVLGKITPHPSGADVVEAAFLRIGGEVAQGRTKPADAARTLFGEAKAAFAG
jgi:multiple sugar transport system substrate-binding protein